MQWQQESLRPARDVERAERPVHYGSPSLMRFFSSVGFTSVGLLTWLGGGRLLDLPADTWQQPHWGARAIFLVIGTLAASLLAGLIGAMIGLSIQVRSRRANYLLTVLWQYAVNGMMVWLLLLMLVLQKTYGRDGALRYLRDAGDLWHFGWMTIAISMGGSLLIGAMLLLTRRVADEKKPDVLLGALLALPVTLAMARLQVGLLPSISRFWLFFAAALPIPLIIASAFFIARDLRQRRQMVAETG